MEKGSFDYQLTLQTLGNGIAEGDEKIVMDCLDDIEKHIIACHKTLKKQAATIKKQEEEVKELAHKCKEHYDNAQKVMRYELKLDEQVRQVQGEVHGTGEKFIL
jgi:predicted RNase H-like nuclease (RuvC/YqgF family)